ncbi:MAG: type II toxin-antitoxin system PemK/MazF family toxin [Actinobacteria bacterium]|nr:type II toxin-antitoxin system PemK/MazF family toxin [Actinomycetota bacterium]
MWWYDDPDNGRRPFLVLTRDSAIPVLHRLIAIPATQTIRDIPTEVRVGRADGMPKTSVFTIDNIASVRKSLLTKRITRLAPSKMREICDALRNATDC